MSNKIMERAAFALVTLVVAPTLVVAETQPVEVEASIGENFIEDVRAFDDALAAWKIKVAETEDRKEKRALRKAHPAGEFAAGMRAHFVGGELQAADWCLEYLMDLGLKRKDREAFRLELYDALIVDTSPERRAQSLTRMMKDSGLARAVKFDGLKQRVIKFVEHETNSDQRGMAIFQFARRYASSRDEVQAEWSQNTLEQLLQGEFAIGDSTREFTIPASVREDAGKMLFAIQNLSVGKIAPDFTSQDIDGNPVKLSDTRGKVTVLDFFGFW